MPLYLHRSSSCTGNDSRSGEEERDGDQEEKEVEGAQERDGADVLKLRGRRDEENNGMNGAGIGES